MDTNTTRQKLNDDFRSVMEDIDALMRASANKAEGEVASLRSRIRDRLDDVKDRAVDMQHEAVTRAKDAARATDDYVHDNPWTAIAIGAAIGLALGALIGRR